MYREEWIPSYEIDDDSSGRNTLAGKRNFRKGNGSRKRERQPQNGGIMMTLEVSKGIISALHAIGEEDGIGSVYQVMRNAFYWYVSERNKGKLKTAPE